MTIVGYNSAEDVVRMIYRTGARYVWDIQLRGEPDGDAQFLGQANNFIVLPWSEFH
jgi:hypothetical protein